jgi:hypothetical protein
MIYVYFSCSKDERMLAESVKRLRAVEPEAVVYIANDERDRASVPKGCKEALTRYDRGGTGTGLAAVEGELMTMQYILEAEKADYIVKIDSDIWTYKTSRLHRFGDGTVEPDFLGYEGPGMLQPMGCVYRLSRWGVRAALDEVRHRWRAREWSQTATYAEALTIFRMLCLAPTLRVQLIPHAGHYLVGMHDDGYMNNPRAHNADFVHCGEPLAGGVRVCREHAFTRMALLKAEANQTKQ